MLKTLRKLLREAKNSVVVGFTGTPLCDAASDDTKTLMGIIKGDGDLCDEGFVSYYMATPSTVFPRIFPTGVPNAVSNSMIRAVRLRNFPQEKAPKTNAEFWRRDAHKQSTTGNRQKYVEAARQACVGRSVSDLSEDALLRLSKFCSLAQGFAYAVHI